MKRKFLTLIIFIVMICPFCVNAQASISNTYVSGINNKKIGEELSVSFSVSVSDIRKGDETSLGIFTVMYELIFDDSVFTITGIESNEWESSVMKMDNKYYVVSVVGDNDPFKNKCADGVLYCGSYITSVKFFINNTDKTESEIKMGEVAVGLLKMTTQYDEITEDDLIEITAVSNKSQKFNIGKSESTDIKKPASIVGDKKVESTTQNALKKVENISKNNNNNNNDNNTQKSNNNYLKLLEIDNYSIDFDKNKKEYNINVTSDINSLIVKAETEDSNASYSIVGNDNLKENNYKVLVEVTAQNGEKSTYTINVSILDNKDSVNTKKNTTNNKKVNIDKKYYIIGGVVIVIIITCFIIGKVRDRKIDKLLNKL